ncbi:hypothetical protein [Streptomyces sp. NPDC004528]|uniref:hypothetical protein n=1 Tax=Streptomyces sp. NPDC004528 TaxID=3154550 RepID=UPI0033BF7177
MSSNSQAPESPEILVGLAGPQPASGWIRASVVSYPDGYDGDVTWVDSSSQHGPALVAHYVRPDRPDLRVDDVYLVLREEDEDEDGVGEGTYSFRVVRDLQLVRTTDTGWEASGPGDIYVTNDLDDAESATEWAQEKVRIDKGSSLFLTDDQEIREAIPQRGVPNQKFWATLADLVDYVERFDAERADLLDEDGSVLDERAEDHDNLLADWAGDGFDHARDIAEIAKHI